MFYQKSKIINGRKLFREHIKKKFNYLCICEITYYKDKDGEIFFMEVRNVSDGLLIIPSLNVSVPASTGGIYDFHFSLLAEKDLVSYAINEIISSSDPKCRKPDPRECIKHGFKRCYVLQEKE